ncbi:MAG: RluA family pseudouridine synthase [Planctomycetota bacterium]
MNLFEPNRNLARGVERVDLPVRGSDYRVRNDELVVRLDAFLCERLTWRSRTSVQKLIEDGFVEVAQEGPERRGAAAFRKVERAGMKLRHGAIVRVWIPPELRLPAVTGTADGVVVLHEEADFLAVDKPPLVPVHPSGKHLTGTLIQRVHAHYADALEDSDAPMPVRLAHRLDRETSGVLLLGKSALAHRELRVQFERGSVDKTYLAIVEGVPGADAGTLRLPIGPSRTSAVRLKMAVREDGLAARTDWRLLEAHGDVSLIECRLFTGRQHQIRVHLAALGHPIVGDKLYGDDEGRFVRAASDELTPADERALRLPRQALHHHRLGFARADGTRVEVVSPLATDLVDFLRDR